MTAASRGMKSRTATRRQMILATKDSNSCYTGAQLNWVRNGGGGVVVIWDAKMLGVAQAVRFCVIR